MTIIVGTDTVSVPSHDYKTWRTYPGPVEGYRERARACYAFHILGLIPEPASYRYYLELRRKDGLR